MNKERKPVNPPEAAYPFFNRLLRKHGENGPLMIDSPEEGNKLTLVKDELYGTITIIFSNPPLGITEQWIINKKGPLSVLSETVETSVITGFPIRVSGCVNYRDLDPGQQEEFKRGFKKFFVLKIQQTFKI